MDTITPILIDNREVQRGRSTRFKKYVSQQQHTIENGYDRITTSNGEYLYFDNMSTESLEVGDYVFSKMAVEYKSPNDLENSIFGKDKRLNEQIDNAIKEIHKGNLKSYIIVTNVLDGMDFREHIYKDKFENLKNYFIQFIHENIHFIPATSEKIAFRDILNYWRSGVSLTNNYTLNKKYPVNAYMNNLATIPCLNHNNVSAIFKEYPYSKTKEILNLTSSDLADIKFGKKSCGTKKADKIMNQIKISYG